ncbi:MAG: T9SS type A sorting domain-containing protein [Ignavibacteriae bacterium]|nr:T9SS type A sorting domain-containing protein [Ignavibacteriota bacterium]
MKTCLTILIFAFLFISITTFSQNRPIIIDHSCCDINKVPDNWVVQSKTDFRLAYGHTSHGSQIVTGISLLNNLPGSIYTYNKGEGTLYLNDGSLLPGDLGNPDRTTWASRTRTMLNNNTQNINMVMWSWCGQVDGSQSDIQTYLTLMNQLETDFPNVKFIYMTGHLNGTGVNGNVNQRNEQIRKYCRDNNKILFVFAYIERYDPDGKYFLDKNADDGCNYTGGNWADEWCAANPGKCDNCGCAHSKCLNCQQKGKAFWWLMARVAGWSGVTDVEDYSSNYKCIEINPNPVGESAEIRFYNPAYGYVSLKMYDMLGREVMTIYEGIINMGESKFQMNTSMLNNGMYYLKLRTQCRTETEKVVVW